MERCVFTSRHLQELTALLGTAKVIEGSALSEDYGHDELSGTFGMPDVLVRPHTTEDVSAVMRYACDQSLPVVVRGSGTGLVGAAVAVFGGIMMETTAMNRVVELDEENLCVTVQPGILLMELAAYVEERGYLYPPDPGEKSATIGGNISTNAGGMRAVKYGVTRDYVRGLQVVMPNGDVLQLGGKVVKNASGYSLKDLVVGSEGTLCIITQAVLKLVPKPAVSVSALAPFAQIEKALQAVSHLMRVRGDLTAVEFMERQTILYAEEYLGKRFPDTQNPAYLLLTLDGEDEQQVESRFMSLAALCIQLGAADVFMVDTEERKADVWSARGAFLEAIKASTSEMDECDVVVPKNRVGEFVAYTHQLAGEVGLRIPSFGHAGDGNLHVYLCRDDLSAGEFQSRLAVAFEKMYALAAEMGGQVSGEHGIGYAKRAYLASQLGQQQMALMRGIKNVFDPKGILNPHKVV